MFAPHLSSEVAEAVEAGRPVVALESTIFSNLGLPSPANAEAPERGVSVIREGGAVPAVTAVLDGTVRVGLDACEHDRILGPARKSPSATCRSRSPSDGTSVPRRCPHRSFSPPQPVCRCSRPEASAVSTVAPRRPATSAPTSTRSPVTRWSPSARASRRSSICPARSTEPIRHDGTDLDVGVAVGVALGRSGDPVAALIAHADNAMHDAKRDRHSSTAALLAAHR